MKISKGIIVVVTGLFAIAMNNAEAQHAESGGANMGIEVAEPGVSPGGALWRSFILPGWGHYALDDSDWGRGQIHLGAELAMLASYLLLDSYIGQLQENEYTFGDQFAGIDFSDRERSFRLAVARHESLSYYNDYQERSRNWDQLIEVTEENYWEWTSDEKRREYDDMRRNRENLERQAPAIIGMMVVNRVLAGVNAFSEARERSRNYSMYLNPVDPGTPNSVKATLRIDF